MKLLTKKETDSIFEQNQKDNVHMSYPYMDKENFNQAVNSLLMDAKIVKSLLKQVKRIKEKI